MAIENPREGQKDGNLHYLELLVSDKVVKFALLEVPNNNFMLKSLDDHFSLLDSLDACLNIENNMLTEENYLKYLENLWSNYNMPSYNTHSNVNQKTMSSIDLDNSKANCLTNINHDLSNFISILA